ncbi:hypothetical protein ACWD2L_05950 [Streptomyces sp. NPDC002754]
MSRIFAQLTCTRVKWDDEYQDYPHEEHGWVCPSSRYELYDSRNDVRPIVDEPEDSEELAEEVRDALGFLEGGYEDNADGTFYARDSYTPYDMDADGWTYSYALHFVRKFYGPGGWQEERWHPFKDGGVEP